MTDKLWCVPLALGHVDAIRALADEAEHVDGINFRDAPLWAEVLINSSGAAGWMVVVDRWRALMGRAPDLESLCRSLVAVGRKREREIAGRIKMRALAQGAPAESWPGARAAR